MDWEEDPARKSHLPKMGCRIKEFMQKFLAELPQPPKVGMGKANFL